MEGKIEQAKQQNTYVSKANILKRIDEEKNIVIATISARTVDRDSEVVLPRAFEKDLEYYLDNPVVLFSHEHQNPPVAKMVDWKITDDEFLAHDQFAVDEYPFAKTIFNLYKGGFMNAFSVGFRRIDTSDAEDERLPGQTGITFTRAELLEHSAVPIPANRQALVKIHDAVKGHWDETILGYLEKLIDQPQVLECGHKATYDYEGNVVKDCITCIQEGMLIWTGKEFTNKITDELKADFVWDKATKFFFFGPPPSTARIASLEQALVDTENEKEEERIEDGAEGAPRDRTFPEWNFSEQALVDDTRIIISADDVRDANEKELIHALEEICEEYGMGYGELAKTFHGSSIMCRIKVASILEEKIKSISKPFPNEHSCRLKSPDDYSTCRRTAREHEGREYSVLTCRRKDDNTKWEEQSYRYKKDVWSVSQARTHCKEHDGTFEPASEESIDINDILDSDKGIDNLISAGFELLGRHE